MTTISVVESYPVADLGAETLVNLAAAAPAGSTDPVDLALAASVRTEPVPVPQDFQPATVQQRYSLARVGNQAVMRGDLGAILQATTATREQRALVVRNANAMKKLGRRCLGVGVADIAADGTVGEFQLAGFIALAPGHHERVSAPSRGGYARVEMWPLALRIQHWVNLILIVVLSMTGYYIMRPFFGPAASADTGYLMGLIRFIHFAAGFGWIALALWRLGLTIFAKERQMRWRSLWPIHSTQNAKDMWGTTQYYLFLKKEGPLYVGHNSLQQFTYTGIYVLCIIQIITGLALYGLADQTTWIFVMLSYPVHWLGIPVVRLIHTLIMFIIWAFVVLHVYLAFRSDALEGHGSVSSMINGGLWLPRGTKPVDAPEVQ